MPHLKQNPVATRYGSVLFDLIKNEKEKKDALQLLMALKGATREWGCVINPTVSLQKQTEILDQLGKHLKLGDLLIHFLKVVCQNRRLQDLISMLEDFEERCKAASGNMEGSVETTTPLTPKEIKNLELSLQQWLGKQVTLHQTPNKTLLGGLIVNIASFRIDGSTQTRLANLHHVMKG